MKKQKVWDEKEIQQICALVGWCLKWGIEFKLESKEAISI